MASAEHPAPGYAHAWLAIAGGAIVVGLLVASLLGEHAAAHHGSSYEPPPWWGLGILPFVGMLGCIAVLPLVPAAHHWWESNLNRLGVALGFAALTLIYYTVVQGVGSVVLVLEHAIAGEYIPFIVLLFSLYVISGGISLRGDLPATPITNTSFLAFGALIASFVGTTGASMLLIRPLLQTNSERQYVTHTVIFFIFLVSNIGGCLLPIGDPPLFLGYLRGVSFWWTLQLWPQWLAVSGLLLAIYFVWDTLAYRRETPRSLERDLAQREPLRLDGLVNVALLTGIVACVAFIDPNKPIPGTSFVPFRFMRELAMLGLVGLSLWLTAPAIRAYNRFNYSAIFEVAALFIGIFVAMQVPIEFLNARGASLGVDSPAKFFWATGGLSSFLDNAPTYVVFFQTAVALPAQAGVEQIAVTGGTIAEPLLVSISLGAVFMGAMTYIGNGPNFMVKSIAEQTGIAMPSFFGYLFKYAIPILIPPFVLVTLLFLTS